MNDGVTGITMLIKDTYTIVFLKFLHLAFQWSLCREDLNSYHRKLCFFPRKCIFMYAACTPKSLFTHMIRCITQTIRAPSVSNTTRYAKC